LWQVRQSEASIKALPSFFATTGASAGAAGSTVALLMGFVSVDSVLSPPPHAYNPAAIIIVNSTFFIFWFLGFICLF
jgi:hypothetical protein